MKSVVAMIVGGVVILAEVATGAPTEAEAPFGLTKVERAHLKLSAEDWKAIKPEEPAMPGPGGGGPGGFVSGAFQRQLDTDKNGTVSREEFTAGFARWFQAWETKQQGFLDADEVRDGMNKDFNPFAGGGPGAGGPPRMPGLEAAEGRRNGMSGARGIEFDYVHADLEFAGETFRDVAVRYKGNGTYMDARNSEKKSLKVDLNEFVKGQDSHGLTKLNFHNNITDAAWMNETLAYALYREAGVPAPRTVYTRLALTVPGLYDDHLLGLYAMVENPDSNWAKARFGSKKGLILKPVTRELFIDKGPDWAAYAQAYDAKTEITVEQMQRVFALAKLVTGANDEEFAAKLPEFLEIDEFARFMAVTVWLSSTDSILMVGQNFVVYLHPKTGKFSFVPWDLDRAFGNFFVPSPEELSIRKAWGDDNRFLNRAMQVPAVKEAYLARLAEFQETLFQPERLNQRIDELAALIRPAVAEEGADKIARFDRALLAEAPAETQPPEGPRTGGFRMPGGKPIKAFIKARHQSVANQLEGKSEGNPLGGGGFGFPPGGGRGPGGGGPRGPGPQNFGPGMFLGPTLVKAADADANGQVTAAEFQTLAGRWFGEWDTDGNGDLSVDQLREGVGKAFPPPRFDGPPGRPPGPTPASPAP